MTNYISSLINKIESSTANLYLVSAMEDGLECWHYIVVDKLKVPIFQAKLKAAPCSVDLTQYGRVVRSGWGKEPKPEVKQKIESGDYSPEVKENDYKIIYFENEQDGRPFYVFISVPWERAEKFEYIADYVGNMNLEEWGDILEIGWLDEKEPA